MDYISSGLNFRELEWLKLEAHGHKKTSLSVERNIIVKEDFRKLEISWLWPCIESSSAMHLGPSERSMMELLAKIKAINYYRKKFRCTCMTESETRRCS